MAKNSAEKALESIPSMRLLVAVCRKKSLTEAAKGLGLSLSAASHQLSVLKDAAGDPLFLRTDKGLAPTSAMKELLPKLESIIDAVDALRKPAVFDPATAKCDIRILTYDMGYLAFVLPVVPRLQTESPGLRINVDFLESHEFALNELRLGKADLCINPGLLNQSDVVSQPLGKVEYRLMVRQGHPLEAIYQAEGRVTLEEIARFPQFIPSTRQGGYNRPWLDVMAMGAPVIACNYFNVPPFVVKRTDAVEWIPSPLAAEWEGTGLFTVIPLTGENRSVFTSRLFWAARDERDPLNQWLRSLLLSYAHDHYPAE